MIKFGKQGKEISKKWVVALLVLGFVAIMMFAILTGSALVSAFGGTAIGILLVIIVALSEDTEKNNEPTKK